MYQRQAKENRPFWENIIDYLINVHCSCDTQRVYQSVLGAIQNVAIQRVVVWFTVDSREHCGGAECLLNESSSAAGSLYPPPLPSNPTPTHYFPQAFWNDHLTANKTLIQIAAPLANITPALCMQALMPT